MIAILIAGAAIFVVALFWALNKSAARGKDVGPMRPVAPAAPIVAVPRPLAVPVVDVPSPQPQYVSALYIPRSETLPPNAQWEHCFEFHSPTSNRIYIVAQNIQKRHWSCSCPGWKSYRHCKHLDALSLPPDERPHEVYFEITGAIAEPQPTKSYPPELCDSPDVDLSSAIPQRYVVFDLETTGLDVTKNDIIEIGAILMTHGSTAATTFHTLVKPNRRISKVIAQKTGISQDMLDREGESLESAMTDFAEFIGNLPLVGYGADFDMRFLQDSARRHNIVITNRVSCVLKMARRAWPNLKSHKLGDVANAGNFDTNFKCSSSDEGTHRALGDCKRTLLVYTAAAKVLGFTTPNTVTH
jgi:DNA polymerase III epsilon subunit family exonuclease